MLGGYTLKIYIFFWNRQDCPAFQILLFCCYFVESYRRTFCQFQGLWRFSKVLKFYFSIFRDRSKFCNFQGWGLIFYHNSLEGLRPDVWPFSGAVATFQIYEILFFYFQGRLQLFDFQGGGAYFFIGVMEFYFAPLEGFQGFFIFHEFHFSVLRITKW